MYTKIIICMEIYLYGYDIVIDLALGRMLFV